MTKCTRLSVLHDYYSYTIVASSPGQLQLHFLGTYLTFELSEDSLFGSKVKYAAKKTELERYWNEANTVDQTLFYDDTLLAFVHINNCMSQQPSTVILECVVYMLQLCSISVVHFMRLSEWENFLVSRVWDLVVLPKHSDGLPDVLGLQGAFFPGQVPGLTGCLYHLTNVHLKGTRMQFGLKRLQR